MAKATTVKAISLGYRPAGSAICNNAESYTPLMGVLKGLTIGQDDPDSSSIDAEFFDVPFDIFYDGQPITFNFELANYELEGQEIVLTDLFGGNWEYQEEEYDGSPYAFSSEWEWRIEFSRGHKGIVMYRGLTIGTIKKDEDGALNFNVTITSLDARGTRVLNTVMQPMTNIVQDNRMYSIIGGYVNEDMNLDLINMQEGEEAYVFVKHRFVKPELMTQDLENPALKLVCDGPSAGLENVIRIYPIILKEGAVNIGTGRTSPACWVTINTHEDNTPDFGMVWGGDNSGVPDEIASFLRRRYNNEIDFSYEDDIFVDDTADIPELNAGVNMSWI